MDGNLVFVMTTVIMGIIILSTGYIMIALDKNSRKILQEDILRTDEAKVRKAENNIRVVRFMVPIMCGLVAIYVYALLSHFWQMNLINPVGLGLFAGGLLFAYIGIIIKKIRSENHAKYHGVCKGIVVNLVKQPHVVHTEPGYHVDYYAPVVKYVVNGTEYIKQCTSGMDKNHVPQVGSELTVYYDMQCPEFMETDFDRKIGGPLAFIFIVLGILLAVIGAVVCAVFRPWY